MPGDEGGGKGPDPVKTITEAVKLGADVIKWTCNASSSAQVVEGGFAHCVPEGYSEKDMEGGREVNTRIVWAENDDWARTYKWHLTASWHSNVTLNGHGLYLTDATVTPTMEVASLHLRWEWTTNFPGKGRWVDRAQQFVELPFTLHVKCIDTIVVDTLVSESSFRGSLRGDGTLGPIVTL